MYRNHALLILACTLNLGLAAYGASENSSAGRAGNWQKGAQGSPDIEACEQRANKESNNAEAQNDYGWALRQHGDCQNAEKYLRKATNLDDKLAYAHSNLSVVLLDQGKTEEALKEAKRAIDGDSQKPIYHVVYGNALLATGDAKAAIVQYDAATKLRPDYENAYYNLGRAFQKDGQIGEAKAALSEALKLDPKDERVLKLLDELLK